MQSTKSDKRFALSDLREYNYLMRKTFAAFLGCSITSIVLNLHLTNGIPISLGGCQASECVSGRLKPICGNPPSLARRQNHRSRHFGSS